MMQPRRQLLRTVLPAAALAAALALSISSFFLVRQWERTRAERAFRGVALDRFRSIEEQLRDETLKLRLLRATYLASYEAQSGSYTGFIREFRATVVAATLTDSSTATIAFARAVPASERSAVVATMRANGYPDFEIRDRDPNGSFGPSGSRPSYYPVLIAEPSSRNNQIQGWDLSNVPAFRSAMERASATGNAVAALGQVIAGGPAGNLGVWIFDPIVEPTTSREALRGSRPTVDGFVVMQLRVSALVENALTGLTPSGIDILVYDITGPARRRLLYAHQSRSRPASISALQAPARYQWSSTLSLGGRRWDIVEKSGPAFVRAHTYFVSWAVLGGSLFSTAIMFAFLLWYLRRTRAVELTVAERTAQLSREVEEHKRTEDSLQAAHDDLERRVADVNQRSREIELLSEMGDLLQTCQDLPEACNVVARFGERLFPRESGVLFMFNESRRFLEASTKWGPTAVGETLFSSDECWSLRRGQIHSVTDRTDSLVCVHLGEDAPGRLSYYCLPLSALGQTIGVLHIQRALDASSGQAEDQANALADQSRKRLAVAMAEHAAMAFANLRLRETLRQQSIRDPLTMLFNRRYMEESVEREVHRARRASSSLGVIILDLDHFKDFNDTYGHEAGDLVLKSFARLLQGSVRGEDIPCRFGGEEFVVILPNASLESSRQKAESLRRQSAGLELEYGGGKLPGITISVGVAVLEAGDTGGSSLLQAADEALYRAKRAGRDRVEVARK